MTSRLFVLGLLAQRSQHGYEIRKWLEVCKTDLWAGVLPGSIYHALKKMAEEGLVRLSSTQRSGLRERSIYAITPKGRKEFQRLLLKAWQTPPRSIPSGINAALSFVHSLPPKQVHAAIVEMIAAVEHDLEEWISGEKTKAESVVITDAIRASFTNGRDHINADLRFLRRLEKLLAPSPSASNKKSRTG
jgi:DNA-binding PadR family transcriptional regulator